MTKLSKKGFSLVELMVVIAIVGITAKMAIPFYQSYSAKASFQSGIAALAMHKTFFQMMVLNNGGTTDSAYQYAMRTASGSYQVVCAWTNDWGVNGKWVDSTNTDLYNPENNTMYYGDNYSTFCQNNRPPPPSTTIPMFASTRWPIPEDNAEWELAHFFDPSGQEYVSLFVVPTKGNAGIRGAMYNAANSPPFDSLFFLGKVDLKTRQIAWKISGKSGCKLHKGGPVC